MGQMKASYIPFFPNIQSISLSSSMSSEGVLMFFYSGICTEAFFHCDKFQVKFQLRFLHSSAFLRFVLSNWNVAENNKYWFWQSPGSFAHSGIHAYVSVVSKGHFKFFFFNVFWSWQNQLSRETRQKEIWEFILRSNKCVKP